MIPEHGSYSRKRRGGSPPGSVKLNNRWGLFSNLILILHASDFVCLLLCVTGFYSGSPISRYRIRVLVFHAKGFACQRPTIAVRVLPSLAALHTPNYTGGKADNTFIRSHLYVRPPLWGCSSHSNTDTLKQKSVERVSRFPTEEGKHLSCAPPVCTPNGYFPAHG